MVGGGSVFLLVPAHPGSPGQGPKTVFVVVVVPFPLLYLQLPNNFLFLFRA